MRLSLPLPDTGILRAVLLRELRSALVNRYLQVFSVLALGAGVASVTLSDIPHAAAFFILQVSLYFVSLFAVLVGVSSARAESEEWPILFAQPVPRSACIVGKFIALWSIFGAILTLLFLPALFSDVSPGALAQLFANSLGLAAIFGSLGLAAGIVAHDRVQALIFGVSAWLFLLFGLDLLALSLAQWPLLQKWPNLWVAILMMNPLDAFRIQALFAMGEIPSDTADKSRLVAWWLENASLWFSVASVFWTGGLLLLASRRLERAEI